LLRILLGYEIQPAFVVVHAAGATGPIFKTPGVAPRNLSICKPPSAAKPRTCLPPLTIGTRYVCMSGATLRVALAHRTAPPYLPCGETIPYLPCLAPFWEARRPCGLGLHRWTLAGGGLWRPPLWACCQAYPNDAMPPILTRRSTRPRPCGFVNFNSYCLISRFTQFLDV
jgi:hypothetical protein